MRGNIFSLFVVPASRTPPLPFYLHYQGHLGLVSVMTSLTTLKPSYTGTHYTGSLTILDGLRQNLPIRAI